MKYIKLIIFLTALNFINCFSFQKQNNVTPKINIRLNKIIKLSDNLKPDNLDETVRKSGLEVGLFKAFTSKDKDGIKPKDLLAKYGVAYLTTSITLAIISYAICYFLINNGIDVNSLLEKVGIKVTSTSTNAGTAALAYAVHKAASPIRFPPTVALTPVVANFLGKGKNKEDK